MNSWHDTLTHDEFIILEFSVSKHFRIFYAILWMIAVLLLTFMGFLSAKLWIVGIAIAIGIGVNFYLWFYLPRAYQYAFTTHRILAKQGWLNPHTISISYNHITDVSTDEHFLERVLIGSGDLIVNSAETGIHEVVLAHIEAPHRQQKVLHRILSAGQELPNRQPRELILVNSV